MNLRERLAKRQTHLALALSSLLAQGSGFLLLYALKILTGAEIFASFIAQLSAAAIIGSIVSLRYEVILFQSDAAVSRRVLAAPTILSLILAPLLSAATAAIIPGITASDIAPMAVMAVGFALVEISAFVLVQEGRMKALVACRVAQALGQFLLGILAWQSHGAMSATGISVGYGLALALPGLAAMALLWQSSPAGMGKPMRSQIRRALVLSSTTLVNSAYVNLPVLIAFGTQSAAFVADFGLISRLFTGPVTLIRQVFGQVFLARSLALEAQEGRWTANLRDGVTELLSRTMRQSIVSYTIVAAIVAGLTLAMADALNLHHPELVPALALIALAQSAVNPVASVRIVMHEELRFTLVDVARCVILGAALLTTGRAYFAATYCIVSFTLYAAYVAFTFQSVRRKPVEE